MTQNHVSASSEARDRNAPTTANQIRLQTSRIRQEPPDSISVAGRLISDRDRLAPAAVSRGASGVGDQ